MLTLCYKAYFLLFAVKKKQKKKQVLSLGEFLGDDAANVVTTSSSWADEVEQQADGLCHSYDTVLILFFSHVALYLITVRKSSY